MSAPRVGVVGGGIIGLCTAYALLERGADVAVYERRRPGEEQSAGVSRIFRHAHDDPRLIDLAAASRRRYLDWSETLGVDLLARNGEVTLGSAPVADELPLLRGAGVPAREIDAGEVADRLPLLAPYGGEAMVDEAAGTIAARLSVEALAGALGDRVRTEDVLAVRPLPSGAVEVQADGVRGEHDTVVVCAGRGTLALAHALGLVLPVSLGLQVRMAFPLREPQEQHPACFQDESGAFGESGAYGVPEGDGHYAVGLTDTAEARDDGSLLEPAEISELVNRLERYVRRALPGLVPVPAERRQCWVTAPDWSGSGLAIWEAEGVHLLAGHHLFKHAPALGDALAGAALGEGVPGELRPEATPGAPG